MIKNWVPRGVLSRLLYLNAYRLYLRKGKFTEKIQIINEEAYLCATGPSMKKVDFDKMIGKPIFSVSNFYLHPKIHELKPLYHFIAAVHEPMKLDSINAWFDDMHRKLPSQTQIVTDERNKDIIHAGQHFIGRSINFISTSVQMDYLLIKPPSMQPSPWSVPQLAIPYILGIGYQKLILCGCDHNVLADYGKTISHFYDADCDKREGSSDKSAWKDGGIIKQLSNNYEMFELYRHLKEYYEKRGQGIYRHSRSGWLEFIPVLDENENL